MLQEPILVTGGHGFIGSHLVESLLADGRRVSCLLRPGSSKRWLAQADVAWIRADLCRGALPVDAIRQHRLVFHVAGLTTAWREQQFVVNNVLATRRLVEACTTKGSRVERFIYVSSLSAAGPVRGPDQARREADPPQPVSAYGRSKLVAERAVLRVADRLCVTIVRPPAVYGPRDQAFLPLMRWVDAGLAVRLTGPPMVLSLAYVADVVAVLRAAAEGPLRSGRIYHVTSGPPVSWPVLIRRIAQALGRARLRTITLLPEALGALVSLGELARFVRPRPGPLHRLKLPEVHARYWICEAQAAREELGVRAATPLEQGLKNTVAFYRAQGMLPRG